MKKHEKINGANLSKLKLKLGRRRSMKSHKIKKVGRNKMEKKSLSEGNRNNNNDYCTQRVRKKIENKSRAVDYENDTIICIFMVSTFVSCNHNNNDKIKCIKPA